ncbi:MAG: DUF86 domain-containing protein [Gammaproteobacteria bacterium]|nr:DUF86 domain-containing protein [Gammaproteobacteria bacterium]
MVDSALLAAKIAMIRDAVARISAVLPGTFDEFQHDRTSREVIALNLFVAIQECVALASHLLADAGWGTPKTYGESFTALAEHGVLDAQFAARLRAAAGLRNLLAHQYGAVDFQRLFEFASSRATDLTAFCAAVATWSQAQRADST